MMNNYEILNNSNTINSKNGRSINKIIIVLHGYGTSGNDFADVGEYYLSRHIDDTVFLFPDAPFNCDGLHGKKWFDLNDMTCDEIRKGLDTVGPMLYRFVQESMKKYKCNNVIVIGFSQGAMLALDMIYYNGISKILAYSGIFILNANKKPNIKADVLIVHSSDDNVVQYTEAQKAIANLRKLKVNTKLITCHNIGHSISIEGWDYGINFINN